MEFARIASFVLVSMVIVPAIAWGTGTNTPARNPYLSAANYATTHFNPAQTDSFPYPAPKGTFNIDLRKFPRVAGGPVGYMQLASTDPNYLWVTTTGAIAYVDVSKGGWREVSRIATPGLTAIDPETFEKVLAQPITSVAQAEAATKDLGVDWRRLANNVYMFVDRDNVLYANTADGIVNAYGLVDPKNPSKGIKVLRSLDFREQMKKIGAGGTSEAMKQYGAIMTATNLTYDGYLIIGTNRSITVTSRDFNGPQHTIEFGPDEFVSNSIAVDEKGGIYVASDTTMYKLVWNGKKLSKDEADGAWSSPYDIGREPPSVKFGRGTGSTPTLMGFGSDPDKLVVITDGADHMKVVAFWRNRIPANFKQQPGTKSRRIAGQIEIGAGLDPKPEFIQSEQSVVVRGYGAFVVNNIRSQGNKDKLIDVLVGGPVYDPPAGVERVEWSPTTRQWHSVWARGDVVGTSMVPAMSSASNIAFVNGYTKKDGWELTGMDWSTGETVHRSIFGQDTLGNGAYALIQFLPNGDLLFNSIGGPIRVHYDNK